VGQKVHPIGFRLGVVSEWESKWYAGGKDYAKNLHEDIALRKYIAKKWEHAGISRIEIERVGHVIRFTVWTSRPGVVIGRGGAEIQVMKDDLQAKTGAKIMINVQEIKNPDVEAQLVAVGVASALERRVSFRRAMKQSIFRAMKGRSQGNQDFHRRDVSAERKSPGRNGTTRDSFLFPPSAPTSTTDLPRPAPCTASSESRSGFSGTRQTSVPPRRPGSPGKGGNTLC
jgi:ribosomal protein S3, bacterial type